MSHRLLALVLLPGLLPAAAPTSLEESVVIEAVNDVTRIAMPSGLAERAVPRSHLRSPDRLRTGRQSRAELEAPDGTITRLGANTVFAFDAATRSLHLEAGSLLFHSPGGRGGGIIRSPSASASVLGTTIIAAATPDGGFKLLVLEGRARVEFAGGARRDLEAGQLAFVLPAAGGTGAPGPVLHFDLAQQVRNSRLVQGFARPLASRSRIDQAAEQQRRSVVQGRFVASGFLIYAATSDTQVNGIEAAGPDADDNLVGTFTTHQRLALNSSVVLAGPQLPENRMSRSPFLVPASESPFLNKESDLLLTGLLGDTVTVTSPTLSLAGWGVDSFNLVGKTAVIFTGSTAFTDLAGVSYLRVFSPQITVADGAAIGADFPAGTLASTFYFDADATLSLSGGSIDNATGGLLLQSHGGDLLLESESIHAGDTIGAPTVIPSAINVDAPNGRLVITGGTIRTGRGAFAALAQDVSITNTSFALAGDFWTDSADAVRLHQLTFAPQPEPAVFQATAVDLIELQSLGFTGFNEINLGARTVALSDVHFPAGSTVRLVSEIGRLAPQPNTDQPVQPGWVNFVTDVTYADLPAQDFVATEAGGTGLQPSRISISAPGSP